MSSEKSLNTKLTINNGKQMKIPEYKDNNL